MPRKHRQIFPFRIPFFRIFYSTTYTVVFLVLLVFLAITPGSLLFEVIQNNALQYVFIIGGVYILTALLAILIYSSRLYTNRSVLAGVGKSYIPVEEGEVGKSVRKLIADQLQRSAIVAWEAKPRDIKGELAFANKDGLIRNTDAGSDLETIGTVVPVHIESPPWGKVQHPGWTAPSDAATELPSNLEYESVIKELPNLLEARAVSLAPILSNNSPDPRFVSILRRQEKMGMREYLTQLSFLRLVDLATDGRDLLDRYEKARFSGTPTSYDDFKHLMLCFGNTMDSMKQIDFDIAAQIKVQAPELLPGASDVDVVDFASVNTATSSGIGDVSRETARTRVTAPFPPQHNESSESFRSVLRVHSPQQDAASPRLQALSLSNQRPAASLNSINSDDGSVIHRL